MKDKYRVAFLSRMGLVLKKRLIVQNIIVAPRTLKKTRPKEPM